MNPSAGIASFKYVDFPNIDVEIDALPFLKYNSILFSKDSSLLLALYPIRNGNKQFLYGLANLILWLNVSYFYHQV